MSDQKGPVAKDPSEESAIDTRLVRKLAGILTDTGLTEIEVERGSLKIRVSRQASGAAVQNLDLMLGLEGERSYEVREAA